MKLSKQLLLLTIGMYSTSSFSSEVWVPEKEYPKGSIVTHKGVKYQSRWITIGIEPKSGPLWGGNATSWEIITPPDIMPEKLINVVNPYDGQTISSNEDLIVEIVPESNDLSSVSIMFNDDLITELSSPPFNYRFIPNLTENLSIANLVVIAKTFDNKEEIIVKTLNVESDENVNDDFIVDSPLEEQSVLINTPFLVRINDLEVNEKSYFNIYHNGLLLTTLSKSPIEFMWTPTELGLSQIIIEKNTGATTTPKYINVNVVGENQVMPIMVNANIPEIIDLEINKPINISATLEASSELKNVSFYVNEQMIHQFNKPPYELQWTPTKFGSDVLTIKTNLDQESPVFTSYMSILSSEVMAYCDSMPEWNPERVYNKGYIVKYNNKLYTSKYDEQSHQKPDEKYQSAWDLASCTMVSEMTRPQIRLHFDNNRFNIGDSIKFNVDIIEYEDSKVKTDLIDVIYGDERREFKNKESIEYKNKINNNKNITIKATSSTGLSSTYPIDLELNNLPRGNINYRQWFNESISENSPFDIIASGFDSDGYIKEIIFIINENEVDRQRPLRDGVQQYAVSTLSLEKGEYQVKIILIDNDGGKSELKEILKIK